MEVKSFSSTPHLPINSFASFRKPVFGILRKSQLHVKKVITLDIKIKSSLRNQVFEDDSKGIICYEDDNGEIICEGLDEGPRVHAAPECAVPPYHLRDANILDLLPQTWLPMYDDETARSGTSREGHTCNGFNTLH